MPPLPDSLTAQLEQSLTTATDSLTLAHAIHHSLVQFLSPETPWRRISRTHRHPRFTTATT